MLYYGFKNYEEFKEMFGVVEHGNGVKSRKNRILLSLIKQRELLHLTASAKEVTFRKDYFDCEHNIGYERWKTRVEYPFGQNLLRCYNMSELRQMCYLIMCQAPFSHSLNLNGVYIASDMYKTDDFMGVCEDGDEKSIRYVNIERGRVFKMKAGRLFRKLIEEYTEFDAILSEQAKIWLCEQFAEEWEAYASQFQPDYDLHVDDKFADIYDSFYLDGCFNSCMVDKGFDNFYSDAVKAKAAYLTKKGCHGESESIVARCVIFTDVHIFDSEKTLRLAERQYSTGCSDKLKRQLIMALINAGEIDGYKRIGADCSDSTGFVDTHGNPLPSTDLWIDCDIDDCDVSYQDSFKYYNVSEGRAYNDSHHSYDHDLATTEGSIYQREWSEYNNDYIDEEDAVYVDTRDDYLLLDQTVTAVVDGNWQRCCEDDCVEIDGDWYYAGRDGEEPGSYGIYLCPECGSYFLLDDGYYSDLTEESYCCESCMESAETAYHEENGEERAEWDGEWYDADDILTAKQWNHWKKCYTDVTISKNSFNDLVDDMEATMVGDVPYIDEVGHDGEPVHLCVSALLVA